VTAAALLRPPDWTRHAACDGHPLGPTAWDRSTPAARQVCATCPVRYDCALEALTQAIPDGTWGGLTPDDRTHIAATRGFDRPGSPRHGQRSRYITGCRCPHCREAHRRWATARRAAGAWNRPDTTPDRIPA
jgi:hypothetical protein